MHPDFSAAKIEKKVHKLREQIQYMKEKLIFCAQIFLNIWANLKGTQWMILISVRGVRCDYLAQATRHLSVPLLTPQVFHTQIYNLSST